MKTIYAVYGDPVGHSLSPVMHNAAYAKLGMDCEYHKFRVIQSNLGDAIMGAKAMGFGGLNLTIPLKETALDFINPDPLCEAIGAVNTIEFRHDTVIGHNTDGIGAMNALTLEGCVIPNSRILILGAGGAARAVAFQLAKNKACVTIANRTVERAITLARNVSRVGKACACGLEDITRHVAESDILINTTSVGMYPDINNTLVTADMMHKGQVVFDLVYSPLETMFLQEGNKANAITIDGIRMLTLQGAESFRIWTGIPPPVDVMEQALRDVLNKQ
jgi:shikimate dehydrogenase